MKIKALALLAGGAAGYYFLKTPKGRAKLEEFKGQAQSLLHRSDVQENISRAADAAKKQTAGTGGVTEKATQVVADQVQEKVRQTPTDD